MTKVTREKRFLRRGMFGFCLVMIFMLLSFAAASGAEYPGKTIQVIVPYNAGGSTDTLTRILGKKLQDVLGQPIVVVNKVGGNTVVGTLAVLGAPPDGYTLLCSEALINTTLVIKNVGYAVSDFSAFSVAASTPQFVIVNANAPWNTLEEFIADAKKNPGKYTFSSGGPGTISRLAGELFQMQTGTQLTNVAYSGAALESMTAVLGGHVNMSFLSSMMCKPQYAAGKIKMLAAMYPQRFKDFPNVPTTMEKGYPDMIATMWIGYFAAAKTPAPVLKKLYDAFNQALRDKEIASLVEKTGFVIENPDLQNIPKFIANEKQKWTNVVEVIKKKEKL